MELKRKLKIGRWYEVNHLRKKRFVGKLLSFEYNPEDPVDPTILIMQIDTSAGSGCEWLRRSPKTDLLVSGIRPSLVQRIVAISEPVSETPESKPEPQKEERIGDKLKRVLKL
jgi:hypothetical protein